MMCVCVGECGGCNKGSIGSTGMNASNGSVSHRIKNKFASRITEHLANIGVPCEKECPPLTFDLVSYNYRVVYSNDCPPVS